MIGRKIQATLISVLLVCSAGLVHADIIIVGNTDDSGQGSLRQAIIDANDNPGQDTINFTASGIITLESPLPDILDDVDIVGPGADVVTVSGANQHQVFSIDAGVTATISGLTITGGFTDVESVGIGGGIWNRGILTLADSVVSGNFAEFSGGGIANDGTLTVIRTQISGNSLDLFGVGGGIENFDAELTVIDSTISGNAADIGGGISSSSDESIAQLIVRNSTISGNSADFEGGGIDNFGGEATLVFSTAAENSAGSDGGGILNDGVLTVKSSLIVNSPSGGDCGADFDTFNVAGDNFDTDGTCPGFDTASEAAVNLGPLTDNGGPTPTHALGQGSVAIDAAEDCTDTDGATTIGVDQRGVERPQGDDCDIGAFERVDSGEPQLSADPESLDFGDLPLDQPSPAEPVVVTNTGGGDLVIGTLAIQGPQAGDFNFAGDLCSDVTVTPGGSCTFEVVFTAQAAGIRRARVSIPSNAPTSPDRVDLLGTHDVIFFDGFEGD